MQRPVRTLNDALRRVADRQQTGFTYATEGGDDHFESFAELHAQASRVACALRNQGLAKGDRIAMVLGEPRQFIDTFFGALLAGVVPVPIAPPPARFGQAGNFLRQVTPVLQKARPRMLVTDGQLGPLLDNLNEAFPACAKITLDELVGSVDADAQCPVIDIADTDTAFLQFTSGSTSQPKGVQVSHGNLIANLSAIAEHGLCSTPDDYCVSWLPLNHDMGLIGKVLVPLFAGMRGVLFMPTALFLKRPLSWLHHISRLRATITFAPSFAYGLCIARAGAKPFDGLDLSSLRIAGCGAEPVRCEVLEAFVRRFEPHGFRPQAFMPCYGLAEHTLAAAFSPVGEGMHIDRVQADALGRGHAAPAADSHEVVQVASCGPAFPGHEIRITDDENRTLAEREVGHVLLRGPSVAQGYFEDPAATAATWSDGWLRTGDMGYLAGGELHICGRVKDLIIVHGKNYHPQDIEWEAAQTEGSRGGNVVAFALEDAALGRERVVVAAEARALPGQQEDLKRAIRARLLETLSLSVDEVLLLPPHTLPKTSSGKLQRSLTKELFRSGRLVEAS
jgi:acyl-CoA synthetase (AMP-forming)/AMP-acid ligase II